MVTGKKRTPLRRINLFEVGKIDPADIYRHYWQNFEVGELYRSPFRRDSTPSFVIFVGRDGNLHHKDFGKEEYTGDCIKFAQQITKISTLPEILRRIDTDMSLGIWSDPRGVRVISQPIDLSVYKPKDTLIQVVPRKFNEEELKYWAQYYLDIEDLKRENVFAIDKLWIDKVKIASKNELRFAYLFEEGDKQFIKIYTPYAVDKKYKFITNAPPDLLSGRNKIKSGGKLAFIVKSKKDEMVCTKFISTTCSTQSESKIAINLEDIQFFQKNFEQTILGWDPDETGVTACKHYNQFGFGYANMPQKYWKEGTKDWADYIKAKGPDALEKLLKEKGVIL